MNVLLLDIKTVICHFVQSKINGKLNSQNENQYETLVDKTIIHKPRKRNWISGKKKIFLKMKSFKICLYIIPKRITTLTKMHGTLKTFPTHPFSRICGSKIAQSV